MSAFLSKPIKKTVYDINLDSVVKNGLIRTKMYNGSFVSEFLKRNKMIGRMTFNIPADDFVTDDLSLSLLWSTVNDGGGDIKWRISYQNIIKNHQITRGDVKYALVSQPVPGVNSMVISNFNIKKEKKCLMVEVVVERLPDSYPHPVGVHSITIT